MITLPEPLNKVMQSGNLEGIKPFAVLIRNKWYAAEESASGIEESDSGSDTGGYFALDTDNPIDISGMIVKPNTLSMTLDVNEVAQYKANNVTLTLYDPFNRFIEGTPISFFPQGYQLYGSQVILYYGLDNTNRTPLFVGAIKDLPTHKPESYQVDLKLISPLELLNDIEAKNFSDKYIGETLTANGYDDENNPIYKTANTGVGGFNAVYADGNKMFEGVDYDISQTNTLGLPALVTITNADLHSATITADYYCWKTGLSVEQIVSGLVALAGYIDNTDIRSVVWNTGVVKNIETLQESFAIGFTKNNLNYIFNWFNSGSWNSLQVTNYNGVNDLKRQSIFPQNFTINFTMRLVKIRPYNSFIQGSYNIADEMNGRIPKNGFILTGRQDYNDQPYVISVTKWANGAFVERTEVYSGYYKDLGGIQVKNGIIYFFDIDGNLLHSDTMFFTPTTEMFSVQNTIERLEISNMVFSPDTSSFKISNTSEQYDKAVLSSDILDKGNTGYWGAFIAQLENEENISYSVKYCSSNDGLSFSSWENINIGVDTGVNDRYVRFVFEFTNAQLLGTNLILPEVSYYVSGLTLQFINLSGKSILEALEDFALISGYEFGIDRQGTFFFRPRSQSTTPIYDLDHSEIVKVDTVKKNLNDFFTKLTLSFAQIPLEFYANTGERPTPIDRYGVINKEIDKPEIVNYDNPELAQAIGPQLLALYSSLADVIQVTAKLNLSLELGDVVNLKRNYNLTISPNASEYTKFATQDTYYRACKITGINYNFSKKQMTYTLRDVSNETNKPQYEFNEYIYENAVQFGVKE